MKAAIYARRASVTQQDRSIDARIRPCQEYLERHGGTIVAIYSDDAISGSHLETRPGVQRLLEDAKNGLFDTVITEGLDCLSRDAEDIATIYKSFTDYNIAINTLQGGIISELHIGSRCKMSALFLHDLATKVRRGQKGQAKAESVPDGLSHGDDAVRELGGK
ncbi:hypothetical protein GAY29_07875 [Azospirillum brasilense]|uniref:recombinase family protein n=1 Tax=Azospirillum brasilense TaxID=192 RepID=UPI00190BAA8E|nr:recombinase family protein [Azospirillum brasilense]MBK3733028.1 hypothetical protein [Azospirillum brasilense]